MVQRRRGSAPVRAHDSFLSGTSQQSPISKNVFFLQGLPIFTLSHCLPLSPSLSISIARLSRSAKPDCLPQKRPVPVCLSLSVRLPTSLHRMHAPSAHHPSQSPCPLYQNTPRLTTCLQMMMRDDVQATHATSISLTNSCPSGLPMQSRCR